MAHIVLFHSALGLRPAVTDFAEALRGRGHTVDTPDYYDGLVFASEREGIAHRDAVGVRELMSRARQALDHAPADAVLAGFSLGAFFAQAFAAKRPTTSAAVLLHSASAPREPWNGVPVQVHRHADDPWITPDDVRALGATVMTSGARPLIRHGLEHLQGWGIHNFSGEPVLVTHHPHSEELLLYI